MPLSYYNSLGASLGESQEEKEPLERDGEELVSRTENMFPIVVRSELPVGTRVSLSLGQSRLYNTLRSK